MQKTIYTDKDVLNNVITNQINDIKDNNKITSASESSRMRYLIKKNEEENIDFISTLIRLKGISNSKEKYISPIQQNNNKTIFNIKTNKDNKTFNNDIINVSKSNTNMNNLKNEYYDMYDLSPKHIESNKEILQDNDRTTNYNFHLASSMNDNINIKQNDINKLLKEAEEIEKMLENKQYLNTTNKKKTSNKIFAFKPNEKNINNNNQESNIENWNNLNDIKNNKTITKSSIATNNNTDNSESSTCIKFSNASDKNEFYVSPSKNNNNNSKPIFNPDNNYFINIIKKGTTEIKNEPTQKEQVKEKVETTEIDLFGDNDTEDNNYYNSKQTIPINNNNANINKINSFEPIEEKKIEIDLDDLLTPKYIFSPNPVPSNNIQNEQFLQNNMIPQSHSTSIINVNNNQINQNQFRKQVSKSFCELIPLSKACTTPISNTMKKNNINNNNTGSRKKYKTNSFVQSPKNLNYHQHQPPSVKDDKTVVKQNTVHQQQHSIRKPIQSNNTNKHMVPIIGTKKFKFEPISNKRGTPVPQMKKQLLNLQIPVNKSTKNSQSNKLTIDQSKESKIDNLKNNNISLDNYFKNIFSQESLQNSNKNAKRLIRAKSRTSSVSSKSIGSSKIH